MDKNIGGVIYLITNIVNGSRYVGQTIKTSSARWSLHKSQARRGGQYPLYRAMRKYGFDNFKVETIARISKSAMDESPNIIDELEVFFIAYYKTRTKFRMGYNAAPGGIGPGRGEDSANYGRKSSMETREKISVSKRGERNPNFGKPASETRKIAVSNRFKGGNLTSEHKEKISLAHMTDNPSPRALIKRAWRARRKAEGRSHR